MGLQRWREIPFELLAEETFPPLRKGTRLEGADQIPPRLLQSETGAMAILINRGQLDEFPGFRIQFDEEINDDQVIGLVVSDSSHTQGFQGDLRELLEKFGFVAIPESMVKFVLTFTPCGKIDSFSESSSTGNWIVFSNKSSMEKFLLRDAPSKLGETPGHLDARARWFQKRHSSES